MVWHSALYLLGLGCFSFIFRIHAVFFLSCQFGVIPTGVRLFFFYFLIFFKMQTWTRRFELGIGYGSKKKRNFVVCAGTGAGSVDIPYFDSHLHCCGECPGRRGGGVNEKVSECTEKENW